MILAQRLALWGDKLRDISARGLRFCTNIYDRENYHELQSMALEMHSAATNTPLEELEPLRTSVFARPSPVATGDAAIIDDAGRILLIRRADNRQWAMPGGLLAVGETPAEGVVREAFEETGVRCEPVALAAIHDSRRCGTVSAHQLYQILLLCRPLDGGQATGPTPHPAEVLETGWFIEDGLPGDLDPGHVTRIPEAFRVWRGDRRPYFD